MSSPAIALITTGGTVASRTTADGAVPALGAGELVDSAVPGGIEGDVAIRAVEVMSKDSSALTPADQFAIVDAVLTALAADDVVAVVVTHGTDTMEETAILVDLFLPTAEREQRPVVFTGAQFPADSPQSDGPANIAFAISIAVDANSRGRGVQIALGGRVTPARGAFKVSTADAAAFDTVHPALARPALGIPDSIPRPPRVDAYTLYPGVAPGLIAASIEQNARGIVLAATGSGNTHPDITAEVGLAVRRGVVVVVTSRVPYGVITPTYGGGGGAVDLERAGAIISHYLRAPQARMVVLALLATGAGPDDVARFFAASVPAA